jgi:hypothetical protein
LPQERGTPARSENVQGVRRALGPIAVALLALPGVAQAKKTYEVGIASRSVSLEANGAFAAQPVYLGGYGIGNGKVGERIGTTKNPQGGFQYDDGRVASGNLADGLHVRAFVVSAGRQSFAIADIENQGCFVDNKYGFGLVSMRKAVERRTRGALPASAVHVQCNHSHGGPDLIGAWGGVPTEYLERVHNQTVDAIVDAFKTRRAANLFYGTAQSGVEGRGKQPEDTSDPLLTNQMNNDPTGANEVMDDELRVLQARDPKTGRTFATLLNLNAHPTVLGSSNTRATGDWPQFANTLMSQEFGGDAMTIVGTLGRQQPARGGCADPDLAKKGDSDAQAAICKVTQYADRVVKRTKQALAGARRIEGRPEVVARSYLIQDPFTHNAGIMAFNLAGDPIGIPIMRSTTPPWLTGTMLGTVTASVRIGDVLLSSMPGEAYPQIPLAVRSALEHSKIKGFMTAGLSNDQLGYIIATLPEAYPQVLVRGAGGNDNILFNVSLTLGERLTCSLLRGAGEVSGAGFTYRDSYPKCAAFPNDRAQPAGADVRY